MEPNRQCRNRTGKWWNRTVEEQNRNGTEPTREKPNRELAEPNTQPVPKYHLVFDDMSSAGWTFHPLSFVDWWSSFLFIPCNYRIRFHFRDLIRNKDAPNHPKSKEKQWVCDALDIRPSRHIKRKDQPKPVQMLSSQHQNSQHIASQQANGMQSLCSSRLKPSWWTACFCSHLRGCLVQRVWIVSAFHYTTICLFSNYIEGSLEVKLPTIWTDGKQRWEESEKEWEERRYRCAKR